MTKKSAARLARDEKKKAKPSTVWDDLNGIYDLAKMCLGQHKMIATYANSPFIKFLDDPDSTTANIRILTRDLLDLYKELETIHKNHITKSGTTTDPDEVMKGLMIGQNYQILMSRHDAVITPVALKILEDFNKAEVKAKKHLDELNREPVEILGTATLVEEPKDSAAV